MTEASPLGLEFQDFSVSLGGRRLFALTASIRPAEVAVVTGPSGVGKSTLLASIAGVLDPAFTARGRLTLDGVDLLVLPPHERRVGLLFQDDLLFPHMTVATNLAFGLHPDLRGRRARREAVEAALERVGLAGFGPRDPATLSGGQRARVALLRAMLARPRALLLDEPFSSLDPDLRTAVREFVMGEIERAQIPALVVTHDPQDRSGPFGIQLNLGQIE
jgi:putative thiamine transport system ATP-binding protein